MTTNKNVLASSLELLILARLEKTIGCAGMKITKN